MVSDIQKIPPQNNHYVDLRNPNGGEPHPLASRPNPWANQDLASQTVRPPEEPDDPKPPPEPVSVNSQKSKWVIDLISVLLLTAMAIFILLPSLTKNDEMAPGADVGSHVYIAKYLTDYIRSHQKLPAVNPYWYGGWEAYHNPPKIMPILLGVGYFLSDNIIKVSQIAQVLVIVFAALLTYAVIRKKHPPLSALLGAVLFAYGPAFLFDIVYLGSYPRSTGLALAFPIFYFIERVIQREKTIPSLVYSITLLAISVLMHPLVGGTLLVFFSIYFILRIFMDRSYLHSKFLSLILWGVIAAFTLGCSLFYLAPIFLEKSGWYKLPESLSLANSILLTDLALRIGFPILIFLLLFLFKKNKTKESWPLFITGVLAALFALGDYGPVYRLLAFTNLYPFLGAIFATFCFTYIIAANFKIEWSLQRKNKVNLLLIQILVALIIYISWDGIRDTRAMKLAQDQFLQPKTVEISERLENYDKGARLMPMKYPFGFLLWWLTAEKNFPIFEGWYYSTTIQGKHIAWIYDAINHEFPEYALKRFRQLNIRYLLTTRNFYRHRSEQNLYFLEKLKESGFVEKEKLHSSYYEEPAYVLLSSDQPAQYLQPLQEKILIIGRHAMPANAVLPQAIQGQSIYLDEYDLALLAEFDTIILIGFSFQDKAKAEEMITDLASQGKKIIIDMYDSNGTLLEENLIFLNVSSYREIYKTPVLVQKSPQAPSEFLNYPDQFEIPAELNELYDEWDEESTKNPKKIPLKEWRFTSYTNLDQGYSALSPEEPNSFNLIGYRTISGNKVWFVGPNIFYYAYLTHDPALLTFLNDLVENKEVVATKVNGLKILEEILDPEQGYLKFNFQASQKVLGLVSYTFSHHWKAFIDGEETHVHNLEDLMIVHLPAGNHVLELKYQEIPVHTWSRFFSIGTLIVLILILIANPFIKKLDRHENPYY